MTKSAKSKILIVRLSALGDILHALPAQQTISRQLPEAEIHWLAKGAYRGLLECVPGVHQVWTTGTNGRWHASTFWHQFRLITLLRRQHFDLVLDFQGLLKSAFYARFSGGRQIVGLGKNVCREPAASWFYHKPLAEGFRPGMHRVERNLVIARALGCKGPASAQVPLRLPQGCYDYVDQRLEQTNSKNPVLLNPGAGWVTKMWGTHNYAMLYRRIREELNLPVVVTYGPGEETWVEQVRASVAPLPLVSFPTSVLELAALCRRSRLMVAGDTGPLHLAVAMGTPTVAILGPTSSVQNGPFNESDATVKRHLPCSDCYKRSCDQFVCMQIPVREVFEAVLRRLES